MLLKINKKINTVFEILNYILITKISCIIPIHNNIKYCLSSLPTNCIKTALINIKKTICWSKVKGKFALEQTMKAHRESRGIPLLFL